MSKVASRRRPISIPDALRQMRAEGCSIEVMANRLGLGARTVDSMLGKYGLRKVHKQEEHTEPELTQSQYWDLYFKSPIGSLGAAFYLARIRGAAENIEFDPDEDDDDTEYDE